MAGKVLVVDDDPTFQGLIRTSLEDAGFEVWLAGSAREALSLLDHRGIPHLAVVDIRMPEMDGLELGRKILRFVDLPIIMVTAVTDDETVTQTIESLAEDYIRKPFAASELVARIRRVLRRIESFSYVHGARVQIDKDVGVVFQRQRMEISSREIDLTPIETKLLYILMKANGRTVTVRYLLDRLWPFEEVFEDTLRSHVYRLRRKIESGLAAAELPARKYIFTKRGLGYRFSFPAD